MPHYHYYFQHYQLTVCKKGAFGKSISIWSTLFVDISIRIAPTHVKFTVYLVMEKGKSMLKTIHFISRIPKGTVQRSLQEKNINLTTHSHLKDFLLFKCSQCTLKVSIANFGIRVTYLCIFCA